MEFEGKTREELRETLDQLLGRVAELESSQLELRRAEQALMSRKRVSDRLLSTAQSLTESLDVREVLNRIACGAREILNCYGIAIYLLEDDDETLTPVVSIEPPIEEMVLSAPLKVKGSFTGQAIIARRALVFNDAVSDPSGYYIPGTPVQEDERVIVAPFIDSDIVLGAMCLQRAGEKFADEDLILAETFAAYAATALKNARMHNELQREVEERKRAEQTLQLRAEEQKHLFEASRHLTGSLNLQEVLRRIAVGAKKMLRCHGSSIYLLEPDGLTLRPVISVEPPYDEQVLATKLKVDTSFTGQAIKAGKGLIFNDAWDNPTGYQIPGTPLESDERVIVVPLIVDDAVLGGMCLKHKGILFTEVDLSLSETFAMYASTALKNAQLYDELEREIEERKRGEAALRESEEKYRTLVEQSLQGLVIAVGPDPRWSFVNPAMGEMLGYDVEELMDLGRGEFTRLVHKEDRDMFLSRFRDRLGGKPAPPRYEVRFLGKDGSVRWFEISAVRIEYEGRKAVQATFVDITDSKSMQQQLRTSAQEWRSTFDAISDDVSLLGLDGKVLRCNRAMRDHLGKSFDTIVGEPCCEVIHGELAPIEQCPLIRMQSSHQRETLVFQREKRWFHIACDPVLDEKGDLIAAVHILSDVTERKRADQEREKLIEELQDALSKVKTLSGLLPMCARCKKIRDDQGYWNQLEAYIHKHADVEFTHGICPDCGKELYGELWDRATSQDSSSRETKGE